jgi:hypothetical protein
MKIVYLFLLFYSSGLIAEATKVVGDINCDGKKDTAEMIHGTDIVKVYVIFSDGKKSNQIEFGLGNPGYQDSLCGTEPILSTESLDKEIIGYKPLKGCVGLNLKTGDCDSMHIFWSKKTERLNWWRL